MPSLPALPRPRLTRRVAWTARLARTVLAACCAGVAVALALRMAFPAPPPAGVVVQVATRDLPVGEVLGADDLRPRRWGGPDAPTRPAAAQGLVGRRLAAPLAAGDVVTPRALAGPARLTGLGPGRAAVPLPAVDPLVAQALRPGDHVQVWAGTSLVAARAVVLAVAPDGGGGLGAPEESGRSVLVALAADERARLASARSAGPDPAAVEVALVG